MLGQTVSTKIIKLDPYLSFENYEHYKRLILSSPNSSIEYLDEFEFCWGYSYILEVKETKLDFQLSDGTQFEYSLNRIISKTKIPDSIIFKLPIDPDRYYYKIDSSEGLVNSTLKRINDSTFSYFDKVEIEIPLKFQAKFEKIIKGRGIKIGSFVFVNEKRIRLVQL